MEVARHNDPFELIRTLFTFNSRRQTVRAMPISQTPAEVADAVYAIAVGKQNDSVVGLPFMAAAAANQATGFNPFALPFGL